ncbi:MAG: FGGY family carbohydrate kinase [Chloroflexota bacterium]|nr:FGGY family carbohydrate kinase [Chloroflexota bacterium]
MQDLLLGIDIGTTAVKAALFTRDGALQAVGSHDHPIYYVRPGWVEQNPNDWWTATCAAIRAALAQIPDGADRVAGLAVSAQAPTLIALDAAGKPLRPALIWMDRRAEAEATDMAARFDVYALTGNRADAFYVAPKLRWLHLHEPEIARQTRYFVQITGYINYRLTGTFTLDAAHAGLLQLRTPSGAWIAALCDFCGVTPEQFPPILPGHALQGDTTPSAAAETGLRTGTPVMVGTVDGAAAALEAGVAEIGIAAEMTGTSTVLLMPNADNARESAFIAMPHAIPNVDLLLGAMVASGASLKWFKEQFTSADSFDALTDAAAQIDVGADGVIFLPYMMGERAPLWHTNARGVLFGLSLATTSAAVVRAILEGTAFALRHNVEVAAGAGVRVDEIRSVGGGARSALWSQIKADVLGIPIAIPAASVGAPFGDALLAGMGVGWYPDIRTTARALVRIERRCAPDAARHARYDAIYPLFRDLYVHLRHDFDRAAEIMASFR